MFSTDHSLISLTGLDPATLDPAELLETVPHALAVVAADGTVVAINGRWADEGRDHLTNCEPGQSLLVHLTHAPAAQAAVGEHVGDGLRRVLEHRIPSFTLQYAVSPDDDEPSWYLLLISPLVHGGVVVSQTDTTVHHSVHDVLTELAFHDPLTGLPNRLLVLDRLRMALVRSQRNHSFPAVAFVDLDGFKAVNDEYGHDIGDQVLAEVAHRLSRTVRSGDTCGRWGGDEFVMVIELSDQTALDGLIERVKTVLTAPVVLDRLALDVALSIGIVVSDGTESLEQLLKSADRAMYEAKRTGSGVHVGNPGQA